MSDKIAGEKRAGPGHSTARQTAAYRVWRWLTVMMAVALGALALAILAVPFVGFGSLLFVFLGVCAVMLLVMVRYGHQTRERLDAGWNEPEDSHRQTGAR